MRRLDKSENSRFESSVRLGEDNAECLRHMHLWCRHVEIKPETSGLYAQMTGLPIGSYSIGCRYVQGGYSAMNLRWIFSDFLAQSCASCPHHSPNGNTSWGQKIIETYREDKRKHEQNAKEEAARISQLLANLRSKSQDISTKTEPESQRIVKFLEVIFSENTDERDEAAEHLKNSARLGADLFSDEAISLLLELAGSNEFSQLILPVCAELASRCADLAARLTQTALANIEKGLHSELSAFVLKQLGDAVTYPLSEIHIERLLLSQNHHRPIGGWENGEPDYSHSTAVLVRCFDSQPESVQRIMSQELQNGNDDIRFRLCGALKLIQKERPQIAINLLDNLVRSLELYEDRKLEPSGQIIQILEIAFEHDYALVDAHLAKSMARVRPTVQEDIIRVYEGQFFDRTLDWEERHEQRDRSEILARESIAIQRLLMWAKDEQLEVDIRANALEALKIACDYASAGMFEHFDALLGYYALVCNDKQPSKPAPKILLLNQLRQDKQLENLNEYSRIQHWQIFKDRIKGCLKELCKASPSKAFDSISDCLNHPLEQLDNNFKACCVSLLGEIGKDYQLQLRVLPQLWRALMDYSSFWVRAVAIDAINNMFSYSSTLPPANLVEIIIISLSDTYVVIHKAALRAVSRHSDWFNEKQSLEVLACLAVHLKVYRDDKYQLDDICDGILAVGRKNETLKIVALGLVKSIFPSGEELVDAKIAKNLMRFCKPTEPVARLVAKDIALYLGRYDRDHHNWYGHSSRGSMFQWLYELPTETYQSVAEDILNSAKEMAERDAWEVCHFASFFAHHQAFNYEQIVLEAAANALPKEPRHENFRVALHQLAVVAAGNAALQFGDTQAAKTYFAQGKAEI